jgi:hypothetical protein
MVPQEKSFFLVSVFVFLVQCLNLVSFFVAAPAEKERDRTMRRSLKMLVSKQYYLFSHYAFVRKSWKLARSQVVRVTCGVTWPNKPRGLGMLAGELTKND